MEGKTARGASSPAKPALHIPEPLSTTRAVVSTSSHMVDGGSEVLKKMIDRLFCIHAIVYRFIKHNHNENKN